MKKLVIILFVFALMMGGAITELVFTTRFFSTTYDLLLELEDSMLVNADALDNPETLLRLEKVEEHWNKGKRFALMLGNHTVIRNADERMTALSGFLRLNEHSDATVSLKQAENYIHDLISDNYPNITNLF